MVEIGREEWNATPRRIPIGAFVYSDVVDFEAGVLQAENLALRHLEEALFEDQDEFRTEYDDSELEAHLTCLCFEQNTIEMLAPGAPSPRVIAIGDQPSGGQRPRGGPGRARKWDWEGALTHIVSVANTPDGLPEGHGAQAAIERMIGDWFVRTTDGSPQESEIRKRASQIMNSLVARPK